MYGFLYGSWHWQEEMVQFPLDYGIENNLQPCPLIYLISLATFYFKLE